MKRVLGLDYGQKRIGLALSDPGQVIATPKGVLAQEGWGPTAKKIKELMQEWGCEYAVVGLPYEEDGTLGPQAHSVLSFCERLKAQGVVFCLQDERYTSLEAEEALMEGGLDGRQRKTKVDQVAAALILQNHLDLKQQTRYNQKEGDQLAPEPNTQEDLPNG